VAREGRDVAWALRMTDAPPRAGGCAGGNLYVNIDNLTSAGSADDLVSRWSGLRRGGARRRTSGPRYRLLAVRPSGRVGAATLTALSVFAGSVVLGTPAAAYAAPSIGAAWGTSVHNGQKDGAAVRNTGPAVSWQSLARATRSSLAADKASVLSGQSIVFSGRIVDDVDALPMRNQSVRLESKDGATWKTVDSALANADGSVTFTVKPTTTGSYRLSYAGVRAFAASTSEEQQVTVKQPATVVKRTSTSSGSSSSSNWAPAGVSVIGSNNVQPSATALAVVEAASREAGKPYVFAAAGPNAFDCSGLTMYVFAQFGVGLPHSADGQKNYGTAVSAADAAPGDLIIFLDGGYGYHAAIYAGGNKMWDAPNSRSTVGLHTIWSTNVIFRRLV
jgi:cell wall-associated NlpC family hydrolase